MIDSTFSNSTNITKRSLAFEGNLLAFADYLTGQRIYMRLQPVTACENADQRRGWQDACKYEAEAEVLSS